MNLKLCVFGMLSYLYMLLKIFYRRRKYAVTEKANKEHSMGCG